MNRKVYYTNWNKAPYQEAWDLQERILQLNLDIKKHNKTHNVNLKTLNVFLFCEHPPVYTLGKSGKMENLLLSPSELKSKNIEFYKINRGGDITYHGPGQITGYPVIDLENFKSSASWFIQSLEEMIIDTLKDYDIKGEQYDGYTGVWIDKETETERKICAIGVKMSRYISIHGFALNVNTNLDYFKNIIPCGIDDKAVTSMQTELNKSIKINDVSTTLLKHFCTIFEATPQAISLENMDSLIESYAIRNQS